MIHTRSSITEINSKQMVSVARTPYHPLLFGALFSFLSAWIASSIVSPAAALAQPNVRSLGTLGGTYANAYAVSANGAVVVGQSLTMDNEARHAFRWTEAAGMQDLGMLPGHGGSYASAIGADGRPPNPQKSHAFSDPGS